MLWAFNVSYAEKLVILRKFIYMLRPKLHTNKTELKKETMRIGLSSRSQSAKKGCEAAHECKRLADQLSPR